MCNLSFLFLFNPKTYFTFPGLCYSTLDFGRPFFYRNHKHNSRSLQTPHSLFSTSRIPLLFQTRNLLPQTSKMQFSLVAAAALMASVASAGSTLYVTDVVTITSCAPTVTDCPSHSTVTSTTSYVLTTSASVPSYHNTTSIPPTHVETETHVPVETHVPEVPEHSLSTILVSTCKLTFLLLTVSNFSEGLTLT